MKMFIHVLFMLVEREDTEDTETQSSFDKFMSSTAWTGDNKTLSILIDDGWVFFTDGSNSTVRYSWIEQ